MAAGRSRVHYLARRIGHRRAPRDCCWFHGVDWAAATEAAIAVLPDGPMDPAGDKAATTALTRHGLDPATTAAAATLLTEPINLGKPEGNATYRDGGRRLRAMFDQGVRRTVLAQWYRPARING
jgi:hypothetical protein